MAIENVLDHQGRLADTTLAKKHRQARLEGILAVLRQITAVRTVLRIDEALAEMVRDSRNGNTFISSKLMSAPLYISA